MQLKIYSRINKIFHLFMAYLHIYADKSLKLFVNNVTF